ncbi:MAG: hypothetical protein NTX25_04995 [Proteobacteria bacterium]|nr:hypothetical protein [Pseudomonadota bacterium]
MMRFFLKILSALTMLTFMQSGLVSAEVAKAGLIDPQNGMNDRQWSERSFSGSDAERLLDALIEAGVTDTSGALGATYLNLNDISCSAAVVPQPVPRCSLTVEGRLIQVDVQAAAKIYQFIIGHDAAYWNGLLGSSTAQAISVECSRPVVPNPLTSCTFWVRDNT